MGPLAIPNLITAKLSEQVKMPVQGHRGDTWNRIRHVGKAQNQPYRFVRVSS